MRILWASVRDLDADLCATTQRALVKGLGERGHEVTFLGLGVTSVAIDRESIAGCGNAACRFWPSTAATTPAIV